jgi:hypothetical protein
MVTYPKDFKLPPDEDESRQVEPVVVDEPIICDCCGYAIEGDSFRTTFNVFCSEECADEFFNARDDREDDDDLDWDRLWDMFGLSDD